MQNERENIGENRGAPDQESGAPAAVAEPVAAPAHTGSTASPAGLPVAGRPGVVRDPHTGAFRAASPAGGDPALVAEVEAYAAGLDASYPHASPALKLPAVRCYAKFRRYDKADEQSALRPGGRVPAMARECGLWAERLARFIEALEATNSGKRKPPAAGDLAALMGRKA